VILSRRLKGGVSYGFFTTTKEETNGLKVFRAELNKK